MNNYQKKLVSFILPLFNESECVEILYSRICKVVHDFGMELELICVDDHSSDSTLEILRKLHKTDPRVKIISFSRNFGQEIALMAGLHYASGDCVIIMDADLQDPPEVIERMVKKWEEGFDVVYGVRKHRQEVWTKKIGYKIFFWLLHKMSPMQLPLDVGDFCLLSRRVAIEMKRLSEERPFVRGLRTWVGFRQIGIEYDRPLRKAGKSKYSIFKLFQLALDGLLSFSSVPLEVTTFIGLIVSFVSIIYAIFIGINRVLTAMGVIGPEGIIPGWATLVCSVMFLMGLQFIFLGVLGEYVGRIFTQVKKRPLYIVQEELGFANDK